MSEDRVLDALKNGENTDCVFKIGPHGQMQKFNASKFDLATSSEYFAGLLGSPLTPPGPIRIKHVQPIVFQMILEFTHCGHLVTKPSIMKDWIQLASAADEFLMEDLGLLCSRLLQKKYINSGNVWQTLSEHHKSIYVADACKKLITQKTELCLKDPGFLEISSQALVEFLSYEEMNISSEMILVDACLALAKARCHEWRFFRRHALPYLRLLTLKEEELAKISHLLTLKEKLFLVKKQNPILTSEGSYQVNLCSKKTPRKRALAPEEAKHILELLPAEDILDLEAIFRESRFRRLSYNENKFSFKFIAKKCLKVTGIEVFSPLDIPSDYFDENLLKSVKRKRKRASLLEDVKMVISVKVSCNESVRSCKWQVPDDQLVANSFVHYKQNIFLPVGASITVEVDLVGPCCIRDIDVQDVFSEGCKMQQYFESLTDKIIGASFLHHYIKPGCGMYKFHDGALSIFKSIHYEVV